MGRPESLTFTAEQTQRLFGHEAAEDEDPTRLREYYFKSSTYDRVVTQLPLRILVGHKGIGKSALFQVAIAEQRDRNELCVVFKPDDAPTLGSQSTDFVAAVRTWKDALRSVIVDACLEQLAIQATSDVVLELRQKKIPLVQAIIELIANEGIGNGISATFLDQQVITVYIDDLDRGWQGSKSDVRRISALLSAVRDISNENRGIHFRISLRSDVYFLVRTADESTDKIEGSVIWNSWTNTEVFALLVKRIETYFGRHVEFESLSEMKSSGLSNYLDTVFEPRFNGRGHWSNAPTYRVLMSLIRKRPRDLVKLCTLAGHAANGNRHERILTKDLESVFEEYSQSRIQDTFNEYRSELPEIDRLLLGMKPSTREKKAKLGYVYPTNALLTKIKNIQETGQFRFSKGAVATPQELAAFMYKINFITARKEDGRYVERRYFEEQRYLQNRFADFGYDWEVHPAYRWALQPSNVWAIMDSLQLSED